MSMPDPAAALYQEALKGLRGRFVTAAPLASQSWFRTGGKAAFLVRPADLEDLAVFLQKLPPEAPVTVLGALSNSLLRDGGLPGVVIKLAGSFGRVTVKGDILRAGAATLDSVLAQEAAAASLSGFSFFSGIPGSVGGAVAMNAGAYGSETAALLVQVEGITRDGEIRVLKAAALNMSYRHSEVPAGFIITAAEFKAVPGDFETIHQEMAAIKQAREMSQPLRERTGGSTFRNPTDPGAKGLKAWQLIDQAGCRGLRLNGAKISEKHCNFLINTGEASALDLEMLGEEVRQRVFEQSGVRLVWEICRFGTFTDQEYEAGLLPNRHKLPFVKG